VVFATSSRVAQQGRAYWAPYSVSKAALETLARTYANETADSTVRVNIVDPGATATAMRAEAYPGEDQANLQRPEDVAEVILRLVLPSCEKTGEIVGV